MNIIEFKKEVCQDGKYFNLEEGVILTKWLIPIKVADKACALKVRDLLLDHGYDIKVVPGAFYKIFDKNEKEIKDLEDTLIKIDNLGLKDAFQLNLGLGYFTSSFIVKIEDAKKNHLPYQNPDGSFVKVFEVYKEIGTIEEEKEKDVNLAEHESVMIPIEQIKTVNEDRLGVNYSEADPRQNMDSEQRQVYNEIVEKLSYLRMENSTDEMIDQVIRNIIQNLGAAILRKEYVLLGINDMVKNIMFNGLDINPVDNLRIEELIDGVFPPENKVGRLA